jgi:6-phosphogluconate dehydrogenase
MVRRLLGGGHSCVVHDRNPESIAALVQDGADGADSIRELAGALVPPRAVWVMVPAGSATESVIDELGRELSAGDIVIDGGNSLYKDDVRRASSLADSGIHYLDVGTSGGIWGLERGYCLMIGGDNEVVRRLEPLFETLAPGPGDTERTPGRPADAGTAEKGWLHCGGVGAGHYVKMVHNGIEYGLMQAFAEGFDILANAGSDKLPENLRYDLPLAEIAEVWRRGSVIRSWLLDLTASAMIEDENLADYSGQVQDSGEGRWTVQAAIEQAVPADVIATALFTRFRSRQQHTYAEKVLSAMRHKFGGHVERPAGG